jgi:hypothetical protein
VRIYCAHRSMYVRGVNVLPILAATIGTDIVPAAASSNQHNTSCIFLSYHESDLVCIYEVALCWFHIIQNYIYIYISGHILLTPRVSHHHFVIPPPRRPHMQHTTLKHYTTLGRSAASQPPCILFYLMEPNIKFVRHPQYQSCILKSYNMQH